MPADDYRVQLRTDLTANAWADQVIVAVLLSYVVIAAANTLVVYTAGRRREFGVLRLAGTTRGQLLRMVLGEQALLLGTVLAIGSAIAAAALVPSVKGSTGSAMPYIPPAGWAAVLGGVLLLGGTASLLPTYRLLRAAPAEAVGIRE